MNKLAILGASGHGKVLAEIAELNGWCDIVFFDDAWPVVNSIEHWDVLGNTESLLVHIKEFHGAIVAIGNNTIRLLKTKKLADAGFKLINLIHPSAIVSKYSEIAYGTAVMAGAIINPFSKIGIAGIINTGSIIDHDCFIGDAVHVCPGVKLAGNVSVGNRTWIGIGSSVKQDIKIGKDVIVGAGAVVVKDIEDKTTVIGVPAKSIK